MNAPGNDDEQALELAAYDDALASRTWEERLSADSTPRDLSGDLLHDARCLEQLHRAFRCHRDPHPRRSDPQAIGTDSSQGAESVGRVGRFEIRRELGQGGFGIVFLAYDPVLSREVALKVPRPEGILTPELRVRFLREGRAIAGLDHPNIVTVHECGQEGPILYLASAYCPGPTLATWLAAQRSPVPFRDAAQLIATLAQGLEHAHQRGVVHRDLKPGNILLQHGSLSATGNPDAALEDIPLGSLTPKIADFGLARVPSLGGSVQTADGAILGTPAYMSPEQAEGRASTVGPSTDIHALGAMLYEVLAGRPAFRGETPLETLGHVQNDDPVAPRLLRPQLPRDLATICLKCLHKEPWRRYASAQALANDLRRWLHGEPILARPVSRMERLWRWARRRPAVAALSFALVTVITGSLVALTTLWRDAQSSVLETRDEWQRAERNLDEARRLALHQLLEEGATNANDTVEPTDQRRQRLQAVRDSLQDFLAQRQTDRHLQNEVAQAAYLVGQITQRIASIKEARTAYEHACDLLEKLTSAEPRSSSYRFSLASTYHQLGALALQEGEAAAALELLEKSRLLLEKLCEESRDEPNFELAFSRTLNTLGQAHQARNDANSARTAYAKALHMEERLFTRLPDDPNVLEGIAQSHLGLGLLQGALGHRAAASTSFEKARDTSFQLIQRFPGADKFQIAQARALFQLGHLQCEAREFAKAQEFLTQARARLEALHARRSAVTEYRSVLAMVCTELGWVQVESGQPALAQRSLMEAIGILRQLQVEHPGVPDYPYLAAQALNSLGFCLKTMGSLDAATETYLSAIHLLEAYLRDHSNQPGFSNQLGCTLHNLAIVKEKLARWEEARALYSQAIATQRSAYEQNPEVVLYRESLTDHYFGLARVQRVLNQPKEAAGNYHLIAQLWPRDQARLYFAAWGLASCLGSSPLDPSSSHRDPEASTQASADESVELLGRAVAAGFRDAATLRNDPVWASLRSRKDFQKILQRAELASGVNAASSGQPSGR